MPWNLIAVPDRKPTGPRMRPSRTNPPKPPGPPKPRKPPTPPGFAWTWQK